MSEQDAPAELDCCAPALQGEWHPGRVIICPECLRFYTAVTVDAVPSWWTGNLPMPESAGR